MGGNVRHANKGPDRRKSTCADCGTEFTHGKFSHRTYCDDCRDSRRDPDKISTDVTLSVDPQQRQLTVTVEITNTHEFPYRVSAEHISDENVDLIGYLRLEGGEFAAENVWLENLHYHKLKIRGNSTRTRTFVWDSDALTQQEKPTAKYEGVIGEDFRHTVAMSRGNPFDANEITVTFTPNPESTALDPADDSETMPNYSIDL